MILNDKKNAQNWLKTSALAAAFCFFLAADLMAQEQTEPQTQTEQEQQTENQPQEETQTETQPRTETQQAEPQNKNQSESEKEAEAQVESELQTESNEAQTPPQTQSGMDSGFPPAEPQMQQQQALTSEDLSDEVLQAFVTSANKVMEIHEEAEEKMVQTIEEHDLDIETFNRILQAKQAEQVPEAEPEKVEAFQKAFPEILNEQQKINAKIEASLQEEGLDVETYEDIMIAYQQDAQIQQRVNELIQKNGTK